MKKLLPLAFVAIVAGGVLTYAGWSGWPPAESGLAAISGEVVNSQRIVRTRWSRGSAIPRQAYAGHDLAVRGEDGKVITVRAQKWEGIAEDRLAGLTGIEIRGRYDPGSHILYELVVGKNVLSTYYSTSEAQREESFWSLSVGGGVAFVGLVVLGLLAGNNRNAPVK